MNLMCSDTYIISLFGTLEFVGQLIASMTLPILADKYGKKYFTFVSTLVSIIIYASMIMMANIQVYYFSTFVLGFLVVSKNYVTYIHLMEMVGPKRVSSITSQIFILDSVVFIFCSFHLKYVAKNTQLFLACALVIAIFTGGLLLSQRFTESLKFSHNQGYGQQVT